MHDDVGRVDQHPVALFLAFDLAGPAGFGLQPLHELFGDGGDLPRRPARADDHVVGDRRPSAEIDRHHVFGLVVIEGGENAGEQNIARHLDGRCRHRHPPCGHGRGRLFRS